MIGSTELAAGTEENNNVLDTGRYRQSIRVIVAEEMEL